MFLIFGSSNARFSANHTPQHQKERKKKPCRFPFLPQNTIHTSLGARLRIRANSHHQNTPIPRIWSVLRFCSEVFSTKVFALFIETNGSETALMFGPTT